MNFSIKVANNQEQLYIYWFIYENNFDRYIILNIIYVYLSFKNYLLLINIPNVHRIKLSI